MTRELKGAPVAPDDDRTVIDPDSPLHRDARDRTVQVTVRIAPAATTDATVAGPATQAITATPVPRVVVPTIALPAGYRLLEYRVDAVLGQGGFGITYLATDVNLDAKVAVKEYLPEQFAQRSDDDSVSPRTSDFQSFYETGLENYLIEARTLATFRHPNIVRVARFFEANNTAYMVLEYERGRSLKTWWRSRSTLGERELLRLLAPLLDGLAVVHEAGFLHRDIKPDNIIMRDDDGSFVLLDFGAARATRGGAREEASVVTPGYGPIEQYVNGDQGPWTDLYALAATLYWMISGRKPIDAPERMVDPDPLVPAAEAGKGRFSFEFLAAIDWALKSEAAERPRDVVAFRTALFAAHGQAFDLRNALAAGGDSDLGPAESWIGAATSPRRFVAKLKHLGRSFLHPASWPMAVKMSLALVLASLLPMLITAQYNYRSTVDRMTGVELRNLEQLSASLAGRIGQLIADSRHLAAYLGGDEDFVAFLRKPNPDGIASIRSKLDGLVTANPDVQLVMVFDGTGTAIVSSDPQVMGRNFRFREYYKQAMQGNPYVTGVIVGAVAGQAGVFYSNPVVDPAGVVIGAVVLRIKAAPIAAMLDAARLGDERTPFLVDGDGVIVHHPDPAQRYRSLGPLSKEKLDAIVEDQRFRRNQIETANMPDLAAAIVGNSSGGNIRFVSTISGKPEIAGFAPVPGHDWVVGVTETREYFEAPLRQLLRNVLYSVAVIGLVFVILAIVFARTIVRPIQQLTTAAHALKRGDYDRATVPVTTRDEIGQLARVFNVMIDVLRQRERERDGGGPRRGRAPRDGAPHA